MIVLNIIALCGITVIVTYSKIFEWLRNGVEKTLGHYPFGYLVQCPMCLGVWVGLAGWLVLSRDWLYFLPYVFGTSLIAWLIQICIEQIEKQRH